VHVPSISAHPRALRWLAPVGVVGVAALAATGALNATASSDDLPKTTPAALIAAVQSTPVDEFSGTVVSHLALGLPELPALAGTDEASSFASLLTGSHTMQVWYGGSGQQRVALLGASVIGQCLHYHHARHIIPLLIGPDEAARLTVDRLADHISAFSLAALAGLFPTKGGTAS